MCLVCYCFCSCRRRHTRCALVSGVQTCALPICVSRVGAAAATLETLDTPCLLLDEPRMQANIERLKTRMARLGVTLRPHLKTPKSIDVARLLMETPAGPAEVGRASCRERVCQ